MRILGSIRIPTLIAYAVAKLNAEQFDVAFSYTDRACRLSGHEFAPAIALRAHINQLRGDHKAAVLDLSAALAIAPLEISYLQMLSRLCIETSARRALTQALSLRLKLRPEDGGNPVLLPLMRATRNTVMGAVWRCNDGTLMGWAVSATKAPVVVELDGHIVEVVCTLPTPWLAVHGIGDGHNGFSIRLPERYRVCRIGVEDISLWGSPLLGSLRSQRTSVAIEQVGAPDTEEESLSSTADSTMTVDVIVPVYAGREDTLACLDALNQAGNRTRQRIIVVNDRTPDTALKYSLRQRALQGEILLLERPFNVGFVGAVNTALEIALTHDVVLLNADTRVQGDWLDRLQQAVYASADIATATPMTNNGELVSHPQPMCAGLMPTNQQTRALDQLFCKLSSANTEDVPVGVGFCLYIRRAALDQVGLPDEVRTHRGYGEETEFCLRAAALGWRHVCASRVYVAHLGNVSFGTEKASLARHNVAHIKARYPEHAQRYGDFLRSDPLKPLRRAVQREWLAVLKPGLENACRLYDIDSYDRERSAGSTGAVTLSLLLVSVDGIVKVRFIISNVAGLDFIEYSGPQLLGELPDDLKASGIARLIVGSGAIWPQHVLERLTANFEYHVLLEDYSAWCPRRYLLQAQCRLCDDPQDEAACETCVGAFGPLIPEFKGLAAWRKQQLKFLQRAKSITAPSAEIANRHRKRFTGLDIVSKRSRRSPPYPVEHPTCIAVPALLHPHQGFSRFMQIARRALAARNPLRFVVLGEVMEPRQLINLPNVHPLGAIATDQRADVLRAHRCQALTDFSPWPRDPLAWAGLAEAAQLPLLPVAWLL